MRARVALTLSLSMKPQPTLGQNLKPGPGIRTPSPFCKALTLESLTGMPRSPTWLPGDFLQSTVDCVPLDGPFPQTDREVLLSSNLFCFRY